MRFQPRLAPALFAAALAAVAAPASAQQSAASAAAKGRVAPLFLQVVDPSLPAPARKAFVAKVEGLIGRVLATPALAEPRGFSLTRSIAIRDPQKGLPASHPARAAALIVAQEIDLERGGKAPDASGAYMGSGEGPSFRILVNDLMAPYANYVSGEAAAQIQPLPPQVGVAQGFPVYRVGLRDMVMVTKPGREPFVRVSKAEYLQHLVDESRALIAEMTAAPHPKMLEQLQRRTAALAALSPQERQAPACASNCGREHLGDCSGPQATFWVRPNVDYFDKGAPRSAVQLVAISTPNLGIGHPRLDPRLRAAAAALDLRAIQASLD